MIIQFFPDLLVSKIRITNKIYPLKVCMTKKLQWGNALDSVLEKRFIHGPFHSSLVYVSPMRSSNVQIMKKLKVTWHSYVFVSNRVVPGNYCYTQDSEIIFLPNQIVLIKGYYIPIMFIISASIVSIFP